MGGQADGQIALPIFASKHRRSLYEPNPAMRLVHRRFMLWCKSLLFANIVPRDSSTANAMNLRRCNARYVYRLDLKAAFASVDLARLAELLRMNLEEDCGLDAAQ